MDTEIPQLTRGEAGFDERLAGLLFNELPFDRSPELVRAPRDEQEVVEVVRAARRDGHRVAVLSGGHSWIGAPVRDGGVLVDMSAFERIEIDPESRTARVGPAVRSGALAKALAAEGLAFCSGHCGTPAVAGYLLGGGLGLNWGRWKPACFALRGIRVVTAAGELVVASEDERRDLLWMARGAGPTFPGIVTEFEIELQDRPADTRVSSWLFDFDDLGAVGRWVGEASRGLPATVEVATAALGPERPEHTPAEGLPERVVMVAATAYADDEREAREALAPLAAGPGVPILAREELEPIAFELLHEAFDAEYPEGHRYLADSFWTERDVEAALVLLRDAFIRAPSGKSNVMALMPGNGERLGLSLEHGAYSMDERTLVMPYAVWQDPASDSENRAWIGEMSALLEPISSGHFVSEADLQAHPGRLARSFAPANWERLQELRAEWDPDGIFQSPPGAVA
ncbi:MAG: FAD-binding oxidoreductase [Actinobacteria bacterium]|nr:FAD-binding oxidoreductase [Actinomycetota bacterium]